MNSFKRKSRHYGSQVEDWALEFFKTHSLRVLYRNKKIWGVEHDFVVINKASEVLFVEVKSLSRVEDLAWRIKPRQKHRLLRSAAAFMAHYPGKSRGLWLLALERGTNGHNKAYFVALS